MRSQVFAGCESRDLSQIIVKKSSVEIIESLIVGMLYLNWERVQSESRGRHDTDAYKRRLAGVDRNQG